MTSWESTRLELTVDISALYEGSAVIIMSADCFKQFESQRVAISLNVDVKVYLL